mgnify:CR=1 FL=1
MAINYSLVKLASKFGDKAGVPKFYARAQMNESISLKKFAKLIAMQTTVSYADAGFSKWSGSVESVHQASNPIW